MQNAPHFFDEQLRNNKKFVYVNQLTKHVKNNIIFISRFLIITKIFRGVVMKKALSVLLTIVLLIATLSTGAFNVSVSAACSKHEYTNSCDLICNECATKRNYTAHNHSDCFKGREENIDYLGEWNKIPSQTGVHVIKPSIVSDYFTYHYLLVTDKNGSEVKFNEKQGGWPLVAGQEYTVRLKCQYDDTPVSELSFKTVKVTDNMFPDTVKGSWYSDAITYAVGAGIMGGYGNGNFGTADGIQRQDFLVMLARFDGADLSVYTNRHSSFPDVDSNSYYEAAVIWGFENGITTGYENGKFGVGDKITREQIVTFLYRYARNKGENVSYTTAQKNAVKKQYSDFNKVGDFSRDAIIWAISKGVISGKTQSTIVPQGSALRCEAAQIMYNIYLKNILPCTAVCIHTYNAATCTKPETCSGCGATRGSISGHNYVNATCISPITCQKCGKTRGEALDHNYVAGECINVANGEVCGDFSESYCPKLYLSGDMSKITDPAQTNKDIECNVNVEYRSSEQAFSGAATIKIQGSSSTRYAKKNYTIKFYKDSTYAKKMKVDVGWGEQNKYCLKANWIDKTHSRNIVTAKLAGEMQEKYGLLESAPNNGAIDGFPVEVYINGAFHGLYSMNIPKDEWQFDMDGDDPNNIVIGGDNWTDPVKFKAIPTDFSGWEVEVGPEDDATLSKVQRLVDFVMNSSDEDFVANFDQYLNLDSTLNYYVMMNTAYLTDNSGKNMLLATYDGNVWYPSLYDLDTSWGTNWQGTGLQSYEKGLMSARGSTLWERFEDLYSKEIAERYFELRSSILNKEHIMETFNSYYATIPQEVLEREAEKWDTEETPLPGYDFTQIESYLDSVLPRLDAKYEAWR